LVNKVASHQWLGRTLGLAGKGTEEGEIITIARKRIRCRIESCRREHTIM